MILSKDQMSEEDIKLNFITPALVSRGWQNRITMETSVQFTDGKIVLTGNVPSRGAPKKADYVLYQNPYKPIAIVEAKDNHHTVSFGLQQAITYAQMLDVPFAYSSNGDAFFEHDFLTGQEKQIALDSFPTPDELIARIAAARSPSEQEQQIIAQPYYSSLGSKKPRYYQRNAVNRTVEAIARGQERLLLVMATGTGKTYTAFQIVYRLLKSGLKHKVLYLADRNILVDQSIQQDFSPLAKTIHKINFAKDDPTTITSHEVYFSLYQQLAGNEEDDAEENGEDVVSRLASLFQKDFFDLIIVDECHRGSAKKDSNWRRILEYFSSATQIGMTATPKETRYVSNIDYFGDPVYEYSLREGIDDGFLAPFKVINVRTNIGEGWRPFKGQTDVYGNVIEDRIYTNSDFDYHIILQSRIDEVAREITQYLKQTDRMQKTIVFCANEDHAERMRIALCNCNSDMVQQNPDYVVRITGSDTYGKSKLDYFISVSSAYPVISTTSKLLSTGADCKMTKLIVLDELISSMTEFKQIIGRGTRLLADQGKTHFMVMDFRNVTRLFADPEWDGPIEQDDEFDPNGQPTPKPGPGPEPSPIDPPPPAKPKPYVDREGCQVEVIGKIVSVYDTDGKLLRQESIVDYTKSNIIGEYASLDGFIHGWSSEMKKATIRTLLRQRGIDLDMMKADQGMEDVDDFDFICHVAFDVKPLTRRERANNVKKKDFLSKYSGEARKVLEALLDRYMNVGIYDVEQMDVLRNDPFRQFGSPTKIISYFGSPQKYLAAVKELEDLIYEVAA